MSNRIVNDPAAAGWELDPSTGYWMWAASGGDSYDDTEVRGLISDNATAISDNSDRITALENDTGGGYWVEESPGVIVYTGTAKAADVVATG